MESSIDKHFGNGGFTWAIMIAVDSSIIDRPVRELWLKIETIHWDGRFGW